MDLPFTTLDVFTTKQLEGNPLAVVRVPASLRSRLTQSMKQKITKEFNLSETVFLHDDTSKSGPETREVDIFTTDRELPFAGHPTIGTAVFVRHHLEGGEGVRTLAIKAGPIGIEPSSSSVPRGIRARIPHDVHLHAHTLRDVLSPSADGLHPDLAIREAELDAPVFSVVKGMTMVLVPLPSLDLLGKVRTLRLDFDALSPRLLDEGWREGLIMRYYYVDVEDAEAQEGVRCLRTRMVEVGFEDPATGSAASGLCAYLSLEQAKKGARFQVTQGVEMGRKSVISVETTLGEGGELSELYLGGTAVVVMQGTLRIDV
ncbi:Diaminopimelate epimerase-like protein [Xylaria castorea]|nr:Diaminopimelate epimerase-like protein [Xylaria castorea]